MNKDNSLSKTAETVESNVVNPSIRDEQSSSSLFVESEVFSGPLPHPDIFNKYPKDVRSSIIMPISNAYWERQTAKKTAVTC